MADQKISELTALTGANVADDDAIAIVDTSATETKKIVFSELKNALDTATGFVRITGDTMTGALDVQSTITSDGLTVDGDVSFTSSDTTDQFIIENTNTGSSSAPDMVLYRNSTSPADGDVIGRIDYRGKDDGALDRDYITLYSKIADASTGSAGGSFHIQTRTGVTTADRFVISGSGNVGIGTSSPSDDVEISTSADAKGLTIKNAGNNRPYLNFDANRSGAGNNLAQLNFKWNGTDVARIIAVAGSDTTNKDDGHITFNTSSAGSVDEAMRISSAGNVGIGTAPSYTLDIESSGTILNMNSTNSNGIGTVYRNSGTAIGYVGSSKYIHSGTIGDFAIGTASTNNLTFGINGSEAMRITSDGSVGINDSSPDGKLNVVSTAHNNGSIFDSTGTTQLWLRDTDASSNQKNWGFQVSGGSLNILRANDDRASGFVTPIEIQQAPANSLVINSSGRVMIGGTTVTDVNMLNIQGSGASSNIGVVLNDTNTSKIYGIQNGGSSLKFHDYSASATRMLIDSSGNLLVGKTTIATGTAGVALRSNGEVRGTVSGAEAARFSRLSSDGAIVGFEKDGSTVGSIQTRGGDIVIGTGDTGIRFSDAENAVMPHHATDVIDNQIDIGFSSYRFKDLYLSGGVYLGGTGSANKLDDYEEGTWTPASDYGTLTSVTATYTKIGNSVFIRLNCTMPSTSSSSHMIIQGLPFATAQDGSAQIGYTSSTNYNPAILMQGTICAFYSGSGGAVAASTYSGAIVRFTGQYNTTA